MIVQKRLWLSVRLKNSALGVIRKLQLLNKSILPAALFFLAVFLPAQAVENFQGSDSAEIQYTRRFTWTKDEYALQYEVAIEKYEGGAYRSLLREFVDVSTIEVSLAPGQYRCRVIPYDFLEKPREGSPWMNFEVRAAAGIKPPETDNVEITIGRPEPEPEESGKKNKLFNIYLGAAWMPLIPLYEEKNPFFDQNISLAGAALRLGIISSKEHFFNIGLEMEGTWYISKTGFSGTEETIQALTLGLNMVVQKKLPGGNTALRYRLGGGFSFLPGSQEITSPLSFKEYAHISTGVSFFWLIKKGFYMEAGFDYAHLLTEDPAGCFRPWIGAGWQF